MGRRPRRILTEQERALLNEITEANELDLVQQLPSREDLISSVQRKARTPIVMGAASPLASRRRKQPYKPRTSRPIPVPRFGVQATIVAIMVRAGSDGITMEQILEQLHPYFPQHKRWKLARTVYETARLGKLPNGRRMTVRAICRPYPERVLLIADPESIPKVIGKRASAI